METTGHVALDEVGLDPFTTAIVDADLVWAVTKVAKKAAIIVKSIVADMLQDCVSRPHNGLPRPISVMEHDEIKHFRMIRKRGGPHDDRECHGCEDGHAKHKVLGDFH